MSCEPGRALSVILGNVLCEPVWRARCRADENLRHNLVLAQFSFGDDWRTLRAMLSFALQPWNERLPRRGTSGSVQRGPANPARPGREQRYRVSQVCRGDPEVPRIEEELSAIRYQRSRSGCLAACRLLPFRELNCHIQLGEILSGRAETSGRSARERLPELHVGENR